MKVGKIPRIIYISLCKESLALEAQKQNGKLDFARRCSQSNSKVLNYEEDCNSAIGLSNYVLLYEPKRSTPVQPELFVCAPNHSQSLDKECLGEIFVLIELCTFRSIDEHYDFTRLHHLFAAADQAAEDRLPRSQAAPALRAPKSHTSLSRPLRSSSEENF